MFFCVVHLIIIGLFVIAYTTSQPLSNLHVLLQKLWGFIKRGFSTYHQTVRVKRVRTFVVVIKKKMATCKLPWNHRVSGSFLHTTAALFLLAPTMRKAGSEVEKNTLCLNLLALMPFGHKIDPFTLQDHKPSYCNNGVLCLATLYGSSSPFQ